MKLTYWVSECMDDSPHFAIRTRTKKEAVTLRASQLEDVRADFHDDHYGPVHKVTVEYDDGFDLMKECFEGCSGHWEGHKETS